MNRLCSKIYSIFLLILLSFCIKANAQYIVRNPQFSRNDSWALHIDSIMYTSDTTKLFCTCNTDGYGSWANINNATFIREIQTGEKHKIIDVEGLPLSPNKKEWGMSDPYSITVVLIFDQIPNNSIFDLIEVEDSNTAFNIYEINPNKQNPDLDIAIKTKWNTLEESADFYYKCENYKRAIEKFQQSLPYSKFYLGEKSEYVLYTYIKLALSYYNEECLDDAITYGKEAANICEYLGNQQAYLLFLPTLHLALQKLGKHDEAVIYIKKELEIRESSKTSNPIDILFVKDVLFTCLHVNGNDEEAIKYGEESMLAHKSLAIENDTTFVPILQIMAGIYSDKNHDKSIATYEELSNLEIKLGRDKSIQHARTLDLQAGEYFQLGNYTMAIKKDLLALEILKEANATNSNCYRIVLGSLATLYKCIGNYKKCKQMAEERLSFCKINYSESSNEYLNCLSFCISLYIDINNIGIAHDYAIKERKIAEKVFGTESMQYKKALEDLELCYSIMGDKIKQKRIEDEMANTKTGIYIYHDKNSNRFDVEKWNKFHNLSIDFFCTNPDSFLYYTQKALKLTEGYPTAKEHRVSGLFLLACHYFNTPEISMKYLNEAIALQKEIDDKCKDMVMLKAVYNIEEYMLSGDVRNINWETQQDFWLYTKQDIIENFFYMSEKERATYWDYKKNFFVNPIGWSVIANEKNDYTYIELMFNYCLFNVSSI